MNAVPFKVTGVDKRIVGLVLQAQSNRSIGQSVGLNFRSVKRRLGALYRRAGIGGGSKRTQLINAFAREEQSDGGYVRLTPTELRVIVEVADGKLYREVGLAIGCREQTVRNLLRNVFDKCGVWSRAELTLWWLSHSHLYESSEVTQ